MRNVIQHGKAVADNCVQLHFQPIFHNLRQLFTVPFVSLGVGKIFYRLLRAGNGRRIQLVAVRHRLKALNQLGNFIGVGNYHLIGNILA